MRIGYQIANVIRVDIHVHCARARENTARCLSFKDVVSGIAKSISRTSHTMYSLRIKKKETKSYYIEHKNTFSPKKETINTITTKGDFAYAV